MEMSLVLDKMKLSCPKKKKKTKHLHRVQEQLNIKVGTSGERAGLAGRPGHQHITSFSSVRNLRPREAKPHAQGLPAGAEHRCPALPPQGPHRALPSRGDSQLQVRARCRPWTEGLCRTTLFSVRFQNTRGQTDTSRVRGHDVQRGQPPNCLLTSNQVLVLILWIHLQGISVKVREWNHVL